MKPKFTDLHKYPHGYTSAAATDITATLERARKRLKLQQEALNEKVTQLPNSNANTVKKGTK